MSSSSGRYNAEDLRSFFTLSFEDMALLDSARGTHRLVLALILAWARAERVLVQNPSDLPQPVIAFVSIQLDMNPQDLRGYSYPPATRARDAALIREHLDLRSFQADDAERLHTHLYAKASHTGNSAALLDEAEEWLLREGLLRPAGETTLERLVYRARNEAEDDLFLHLTSRLDEKECRRLDSLCDTSSGESLHAWLTAPARSATIPSILLECKRLQAIREHLPDGIDWGPVTLNRRRQWANIVRRHYAQALRRYPETKRHTLLLAFLSVRAEEVTDIIVEMMDILVGKAFSKSEDRLDEVKVEKAEASTAGAKLFLKMAEVLLDLKIPKERVRDEIFRRVPKERVTAVYEQTSVLDLSDVKALFEILSNRFPNLRKFIPTVLETLRFGSQRAPDELIDALKILREMGTEGLRKVPEEAPVGFVPKPWMKIVRTPDGIDRRAWELSLLFRARGALRAGELTIEGSRRYTPWDTELYSPEEWRSRRASWYAESGIPEDGSAYLQETKEALHLQAQDMANRIPHNQALRIERGRIILTALEKIDIPEAEATREKLAALLPLLSLPELLMEVDQWTGFTSDLLHLASRRPPSPEHVAAVRPAIFAVLVAEALNLGLATMAFSSGIPYGQLIRTYDWYFREETLRQAITRLIRYHRTLPLTEAFGSGTTSSSDGIRFGVAASALNARPLPRYFDMRRGVTVYSHVSDQGCQFWTDVISCHAHDGTYVLDGLLHQDVLPIKEHYTDTHGYTDLIFGLFELLGYRFAPRLADLKEQLLARPWKGGDYGSLNPVLRAPVRDAILLGHWDDLNRLAASLKDGRVRPSLVVSKLQAMRRQNQVQQALQELGRLQKTRHILGYADDENERRRCLVGLNRGERVNSMARTISFARQGRFCDRGYEDQLNRASSLSLAINAITVWNTRYLALAAEELARLSLIISGLTSRPFFGGTSCLWGRTVSLSRSLREICGG